jgi:methionyl-tRNA formyltransferase
MTKKLTITILTSKESWMNEYNVILADELQKHGHSVRIIHDKNELQEGDIAFFLGCYEIIDRSYLKLHKSNIVVHESDLPQGKGWSPMRWQILEGKNDIPVTLFEAVEKPDAGDIYMRDVIHLDGDELYNEWRAKLGDKTCSMCLEYALNYAARTLTIPKKQIGKESFYPRRTRLDDVLDVNKPLAEQFNHLRIVDNDNFPAYFEYNGKKYIIKIFKQEIE